MITRHAYMNREVTHREYYGQFVSPPLRYAVMNAIGLAHLQASTDEHFNDIALHRWDRLQSLVMAFAGRKIGEANGSGGVSLSDCVCTAKEAARQAVEHAATTEQEATHRSQA